MILSAHIVETDKRTAINGVRPRFRPDPDRIDGLRYAETWLMTPLRTGLFPSTDVAGVAMVAAWDDDDALDHFLQTSLARPYEGGWRARFQPVRTVGAWPALPDLPRQEQPTGDHPVAVLTMARMRLGRSALFAAAAGPAERDARTHPAFLGGVSLLRPPTLVATFTLWRTAREMRNYVVGSSPGGHSYAMKRNDERVFHHETVFVRLRPYATEGQWGGRNPLPIGIGKEITT